MSKNNEIETARERRNNPSKKLSLAADDGEVISHWSKGGDVNQHPLFQDGTKGGRGATVEIQGIRDHPRTGDSLQTERPRSVGQCHRGNRNECPTALAIGCHNGATCKTFIVESGH